MQKFNIMWEYTPPAPKKPNKPTVKKQVKSGKWVYEIPDDFIDMYDWPEELEDLMDEYLYHYIGEADYELCLKPKDDIPDYCEPAKEGLKEMNPDLNYADILVAMLNGEYSSSLLGNVEPCFQELIFASLAEKLDIRYVTIWTLMRYGFKNGLEFDDSFGDLHISLEHLQSMIYWEEDK